jgi:GNAT superfamily N-acetyltransferase
MSNLTFRNAIAADIPVILDLYFHGAPPDNPHPPYDPKAPEYQTAFDVMAADPNQMLIVAEQAGEVIGTMQITFIPGLSYKGGWRGQLESVHVRADQRGKGTGAAMVEHGKKICLERGCTIVQLTSNKARTEAHRFYGRLGFKATHEGFKYMAV